MDSEERWKENRMSGGKGKHNQATLCEGGKSYFQLKGENKMNNGNTNPVYFEGQSSFDCCICWHATTDIFSELTNTNFG